MKWSLLLVVVRDASRDLLLDEARGRSQKGKLACVKHLLLFFNLVSQVYETLAIQADETEILP